MSGRSQRKRNPEDELHRVVIDDLKRTRLSLYRTELKGLYDFYLDDDRREELAGKGRIARAFLLLGWILKSLLMKLSPARRLMLLSALVLGVVGWKRIAFEGFRSIEVDFRPAGFLLLVIVLMLELRDKLLVRDEIEVARQVQLALLPNHHPAIPGWSVWSHSRPANDVGGDLVDYIDLGGFRHAVLVGDVAGKGLGAALLSAKLQATVRALITASDSFEDLGLQTNKILHSDGLDNRYATLFLIELEHHSGRTRYLNAGHNPAFVVRADRIEQLDASSFPLGMLPTAAYVEGSLVLEPGELIVIYSDGLTEAVDEHGNEFGAARLRAMLGGLRGTDPEQAARTILNDVDAFLSDTRPQDDLSLAIIARR